MTSSQVALNLDSKRLHAPAAAHKALDRATMGAGIQHSPILTTMNPNAVPAIEAKSVMIRVLKSAVFTSGPPVVS